MSLIAGAISLCSLAQNVDRVGISGVAIAEEILKDEKARNTIYRQTSDMKLFNAIRAAVSLDEKEVSVDEFNELFRAEAAAENA